jgi:hypothetical protein
MKFIPLQWIQIVRLEHRIQIVPKMGESQFSTRCDFKEGWEKDMLIPVQGRMFPYVVCQPLWSCWLSTENRTPDAMEDLEMGSVGGIENPFVKWLIEPPPMIALASRLWMPGMVPTPRDPVMA